LKNIEITKNSPTLQYTVFIFTNTTRNTAYCQRNRKHSFVLLNFHTLLLIRNKSSDFFCFSEIIRSLARNYSEPRANHSRGSSGSNTWF